MRILFLLSIALAAAVVPAFEHAGRGIGLAVLSIAFALLLISTHQDVKQEKGFDKMLKDVPVY
ncbi:MAG: hypothetical protein JRN52_15395 [Nitrososphaerota archaeon]|nr:hypothetical protein [Nitrososphaerota archaeon]